MSLKTKIAAVFNFAKLKSPVSLEEEMFAAIDKGDMGEVERLAKFAPSLLTDPPAKDTGLPQTPGAAFILRAFNDEKPLVAQALVRINPALLTGADENGANFAMHFAKNHDAPEVYRHLVFMLTPEIVNAADKDGNRLLHYAAMHQGEGQSIELTQPFTSKQTNMPNNKGETPLMLAAYTGTVSGMQYLMTLGSADINLKDKAGLNATMHAIEHSSLKNATWLMQLGGEVDFGNPAVENQIRVSTYDGDFEFLKALEQSREAQALGEKQRAQANNIAQQVQTALELKQNVQQVVAVVKGGVGSDVIAPDRAAFRKKNTGQTPV